MTSSPSGTMLGWYTSCSVQDRVLCIRNLKKIIVSSGSCKKCGPCVKKSEQKYSTILKELTHLPTSVYKCTSECGVTQFHYEKNPKRYETDLCCGGLVLGTQVVRVQGEAAHQHLHHPCTSNHHFKPQQTNLFLVRSGEAFGGICSSVYSDMPALA